MGNSNQVQPGELVVLIGSPRALKFGKLIRESTICVLCGERLAATKEHIPPAALFIKKPQEYLLVPACDSCNSSTKLDDEHLVQVMAAASPWGQGVDVWKTKVAPKLKTRPRTRAGLRNRLITYPLNVKPWGTLPLIGMKIERARIHTSAWKLVSGLYWFHKGELLSKNVQFTVTMLNVDQLVAHFNDPDGKRYFRQTEPGVYNDPEVRKTFFYYRGISQAASLWYFFFYKQNVVIAGTEVPGQTVDGQASPNEGMQPAAQKPGGG